MAATIAVSVLVNLLLVTNTALLPCSTVLPSAVKAYAGTGRRWRRALSLPWLLFYGAGIVACLWCHALYTSLCWREEKV